MFNKIKTVFKKKYTGISDESIPKGAWEYDELNLVSSSDPFRTLLPGEFLSYKPRRQQDGSGSCVAQTCAGMHDDLLGIETSALPIYPLRSNKPAPGMSYADVVKLLPTCKIYSETQAPSQFMSDIDMDKNIITGTSISNAKLEAFWLPKSFDEVAKAFGQNGYASIWFKGNYDEWLKWIIDDLSSESNQVRHSVRVIDAIRKENVEYLVILDSAGTYRTDQIQPDWINGDGVRLVTRKAFEQGVFNQWTAKPIQIVEPQNKPFHNFTYSLKYGMLKNNDVLKLQEILIYEGLLDREANTGNYKNMTRSAVRAFQLKHKVANVQEITQLAGTSCGPKTRAMLNKLYGNQ